MFNPDNAGSIAGHRNNSQRPAGFVKFCGDIIVCMPQSFMNRHTRGNMKLDNCKFIAIDEIDDIYKSDRELLGNILKIIAKEPRPNLITCSATMEKKFLEFYKEADPDYITLNINAELSKETGH